MSARTPRASALRASRAWASPDLQPEGKGVATSSRGRQLSSPRRQRLNASPGPAAAVSPAPAAKGKTPTRVRAASPAGVAPGGRAKKSVDGTAGSVHFEFGGPLGAAAITLGLPCVCYALVRFCHAGGCLRLAPLRVPPSLPAGAYASLTGVAAFLSWFALCLGLHLLLPGARVQGTLLRNGQRLTYKLNGEGAHVCHPNPAVACLTRFSPHSHARAGGTPRAGRWGHLRRVV